MKDCELFALNKKFIMFVYDKGVSENGHKKTGPAVRQDQNCKQKVFD